MDTDTLIPKRTSHILVTTTDNNLIEYIESLKKTRKEFESKPNLLTWNIYNVACKALYHYIKNMPESIRNDLTTLNQGHFFCWELHNGKKLYQLDLGFEYLMCLMAGSLILLKQYMQNIQSNNTRDIFRIHEQIISDSYFVITCGHCADRNSHPILQKKTIYSINIVHFLVNQMYNMKNLLDSLDIKRTSTIEEISETVGCKMDNILAKYLGACSLYKAYCRSKKNIPKLDVPLSDWIDSIYIEIKTVVKCLIYFIDNINLKYRKKHIKRTSNEIADVIDGRVYLLSITQAIHSCVFRIIQQFKDRTTSVMTIEYSYGCKDIEEYIESEGIKPEFY